MPTSTSAVERTKLDTYTVMERQMEASRQLRAVAVADAVANALAALPGAVRRMTLRAAGTPS